ncbi:MAG: polysaccharide pyruvyl transferase family protein, partial [Actinomycetota bacterium]
MSEERFRVAIVGTFDVENYGDLLFPLLAQESLGKRLGELELLIFSYNSKPRGAWPFEVRSLEDLPEALTDVDALLIGGGHLFRFDKQVGVEYGPPSSNIHHPTGYWLVPALLGALSGKPVIWNGIGVSVDTPEWGRTMATTALRASSYVSVRDKPSARELLRLAPEAEIHVIPDTAFGLSELLSREPTEEFLRWRTSIGLQREYVVIQPAPALKPYASVIREALASLSARGVQVVELVIGPAVGDEVGILHLDPPPVTASLWSQPLLLAEVVKGASAVIAQSLHLSITALCVDVPLFRVQSDEGSKYSILESQPGVWMFDGTAGVLAESLGSVLSGRPLGKSMKPELDKLNVHW